MELVQRGAREHPDARVRRECLNVLDGHANDESSDVFRAALFDPVPHVRVKVRHGAVLVIARFMARDARVVDVLALVAREDFDPLVRQVGLAVVEGRGRDVRSRKALRRREVTR